MPAATPLPTSCALNPRNGLSTFNAEALLRFSAVFQMTMPIAIESAIAINLRGWRAHGQAATSTTTDSRTETTVTKTNSRIETTILLDPSVRVRQLRAE